MDNVLLHITDNMDRADGVASYCTILTTGGISDRKTRKQGYERVYKRFSIAFNIFINLRMRMIAVSSIFSLLYLFIFIYLFVYSRHEVHSMNTHTLHNAG